MPTKWVASVALGLVLAAPVRAQITTGNAVKMAASTVGASFPQGITYHPVRNSLFVLDDFGKVTEFDLSGRVLNSFTNSAVSGGGGITYDPVTGDLLISSGALIHRVRANGSSFSTLLDVAAVSIKAEGIAVHPVTGNIWIADDSTEEITELDRKGKVQSSFRTRTILVNFVEPTGLAFLGNDLLVVDDREGTHSLYLVSTAGTLIQTIADTALLGITDPEGVTAVGESALWIAGDKDDALLSLEVINPADEIHELYFAQFGDGGGLLFSQIMLVNLDDNMAAQATITLKDAQGLPLSEILNGELVTGQLEAVVPAGGLKVVRSDGEGPITSGSVTVSSDKPLAGVILFGGSVGVAGVGSGMALSSGFVAPVENNEALQIRVGVAIMNLEDAALQATLQLFDSGGTVLPTTSNLTISGKGRESKFLDELFRDLDLSDFQGVLKVTAGGTLAATIIQTRPGEFVTLPVAPLDSGSQQLFFAQIGDGGGLLFSQIMLVNLNAQTDAAAQIILKDAQGQPLALDLSGVEVMGEVPAVVPAGGLEVLATDGLGPVTSGSVIINSDQPLAGVILFGGTVGVAGVGSSLALTSGFVAPMENTEALQIRVGIALMNLEPTSLQITLELSDAGGTLVATSSALSVAGGGRESKFLDELFPRVDLSDFSGVLRVTAPGRIAATVIQTRPGQFATLPVAPK
ncbi:MAG: hypothetical protein ACE5JX_10030 [Acidobacteriota bacterium]